MCLLADHLLVDLIELVFSCHCLSSFHRSMRFLEWSYVSRLISSGSFFCNSSFADLDISSEFCSRIQRRMLFAFSTRASMLYPVFLLLFYIAAASSFVASGPKWPNGLAKALFKIFSTGSLRSLYLPIDFCTFSRSSS